MLRYKKKEDFHARFAEVDEVVEKWRSRDKDVSDELRQEFLDKLIISLIYHDSALEGEVLSHSEIKASIDTKIISDTSLIPAYDQINNFHACVRLASDIARTKRRGAIKLDTTRELHDVLQPDQVGAGYRKENPLHRLYYHEISPPDKVAYRMRKYGEWLDSAAIKSLHPIRWAAEAHWRLMAIFPWSKSSGQVARVLANLILERSNLPMAVIHSIDRQRYYEALRSNDSSVLLSVYLEGVETTATAALRVYEAAGPAPRRPVAKSSAKRTKRRAS